HVLSQNIRFEADLVDQLFNSSEKRLARVLLLLANFGKDRGAADGDSKNQPGNLGRDHWHYPLQGEFLYEPIPETGIHRLQRWAGGSQLPVERSAARLGLLH